MPTYDVIEAALNAPIDWAVFEKLVADVLAQDDMPTLRRAGGYKDGGVDAYETALFGSERNPHTAVQITSQRAQSLKVDKTIERLRSVGITPEAVTFVFRHPVSSTVRAAIGRQCSDAGLECDVRDQTYLMIQLGKNTTGLFARYFESVKSQFAALLSTPDPLSSASDRTRHAMLLSLASFILHPRARLVRQALFEKTAIAALVSIQEGSEADVARAIKELMPEEDITTSRVATALSALQKAGECELRDAVWRPTDACVARFGQVMGAVKDAYLHIVGTILDGCATSFGADQAALGFAERNIRRALMRLLRVVGPLDAADNESPFLGASTLPEIKACLAQDIKDTTARCLMIAFGGYIENPDNRQGLALFARSYSALALRNLDPVGRRWQAVTLQRSLIALDTDAVLNLLVRNLPEHQPLLRAIEALTAQGLSVVISPEVIKEVTGHIERANRTFRRFSTQLDRMSPAMADACIWHAVVRGYYYARAAGYSGTWRNYWAGYYDERNPAEFIRYQVSKLPKCRIEDLSDIPKDWFADLEAMTEYIVSEKEEHRYKASFRDPDQMRDRVRLDLRMALHLAAYPDRIGRNAKGYLATEDRGFFKAEYSAEWGQRARVAVLTRAIPQLADFACGSQLADDDVVRLLYEPVLAAAAESLSAEIDTLTALGVNLRDISLPRLEWALQSDFHDAIHDFRNDGYTEKKLDDAVRLVGIAAAKGLPVDSFITDLSAKYEEAKQTADDLSKGEEVVNERLKSMALAMARTKKGRRRANRVLREFNLTVADLKAEEDDDEPKQEN